MPIIIIISIISILTLTIVLWLIMKKYRQGQGTKGVNKKGISIRDYKGHSYEYHYFSGAKNSPSFLSISLNTSNLGKFVIRKESKFDVFFKNIGLTKEIQTGDKDFDDKFYITTDNAGFTKNYLNNKAVLQAIKAIYETGFKHIEVNKNKILAKKSPCSKKDKVEDKTIETIVENLLVIQKNAPETVEWEAGNQAWKLKRIILFAVLGLLFILSMIFLIAGLATYPVLDAGKLFLFSLKYSIILWLVSCWISIKLLKGRASSHIEFLIAAGVFLFSYLLGAFGMTSYLNGKLDNSVPYEYQQLVIDKKIETSKNSKTYYAIVNSWREDRETEKIKVGKSHYDKINSGETLLLISTKPGAFGFEWITDYQIAPEQEF